MGESYSMKSKKRNEDARHRKDYLDGLKRFKKRGIPIIIDGKECRGALRSVYGPGSLMWEKTEPFIWETMSVPIKAV